MKSRLLLLFPYICGAAVIAVAVWSGTRSNVTVIEPVAEATAKDTAVCPICQMDVEIATAEHKSEQHGRAHYYCSDYCKEKFLSEMALEVAASALADSAPTVIAARIDPVCGMEVGVTLESQYDGASYFFCTEMCREEFNETPQRYLVDVCLVCQAEKTFTPIGSEQRIEATWQGKTYGFCSEAHRDAFRADPAGYFMHTMWGIPNWLYYCSIAFVLALSFGLIEWREGSQGSPSATNARIDLLKIGMLNRILCHPATRFAAQAAVTTLFILIIAAGLFGNQLPGKNVAPLLTWTIWWGGLVILIMYAGKAWCYVCPWDAIAGWSEGLRFWGKKKESLSLGLKWPKIIRNIWPATILFVGLTWIELGFGVTMNPRATAYLALAMLGLAFFSAFIFDRKSFCRYGCLVGRISGLYALFAPVEVRARSKDACRTCSTASC